MLAYIFAYGSLLHPDDWVAREMPGKPIYGLLEGHERHFEVAIDNLSPSYDKKHYREDGERVPFFVGTLGLREKRGAQSNGLAIPVDKKLFDRIKIREQDYILSSDISHLFSEPLDKPLLTFLEKEANHKLYLKGKREGNLFLPRRYLDYCLEGFDHYGGQEDFLRLTKEVDYPFRDLRLYRQDGAI